MVAQRTLTPYVEVRILLPLPKKGQAPNGACFFFIPLQKGFGPVKVCAFRKQSCGLFFAQSARRVLKFARISVAERTVCKAKPPQTVESFYRCQISCNGFFCCRIFFMFKKRIRICEGLRAVPSSC